jgi:hypothetical protein
MDQDGLVLSVVALPRDGDLLAYFGLLESGSLACRAPVPLAHLPCKPPNIQKRQKSQRDMDGGIQGSAEFRPMRVNMKKADANQRRAFIATTTS